MLRWIPIVAAACYAATPQDQPVFRAHADLVVVHAMVEDGRGRAVANLTREHFLVYEDNRPQTLTMFSAVDAPATIGLLIDNSTSMASKRERVIAAAVEFASLSHPEDEVFVLTFNEHVRVAWPLQVLNENSLSTLRTTLGDQVAARGQTALYDAVLNGLDRLAGGTHPRQVLVLVSDGGDNASRRGANDMMRAVESSNAMLYAVSMRDPVDPGNHGLLRRVTERSGGEVFSAENVDEVPDALAHIARDIRATYTLGFVPSNQSRDGKRRELRVVARQPGGPTLRVRARSGYMAPKDAGSRERS
jgi:Ca-activated chloride channel family protein